MNKREFLNELQNALEGKLSESDIGEIISDYGDIFDNGTEDGRSEEDVAREIGSPARIARTILEDGADIGREAGGKGSNSTEAGGKREYTDFQKNINEKTSRIFDKITEPDQGVEIEQLAPMSRRLGAYVIDCLLLGIVIIVLSFIFLVPLSFMSYTSVESAGNVSVKQIAGDAPVQDIADNTPVRQEIRVGGGIMDRGIASSFAYLNIFILFLLFGAFSLFTTLFLWATNGYTPGKWLLNMRVVKINGSKIGFLDAFLRELVIKCLANSMLSGFLNVGSFIWGCVTDDHKTVHDLVAQTRVIKWDRTKKIAPKAPNPIES